MNPIRSVLVHFDGTPSSVQRLRVARRIASAHDASVCALYAVTPAVLQVPPVLDAGGSATALLEDLDAERQRRARQRFAEAARDHSVALRWLELVNEPVIPGFIREALCADLLVLGQHAAAHAMPHDVPADFVEAVLAGSGKPAVVLPRDGHFDAVGRRAVVAWKASREAAHALDAAWPLLQRAEQVHLVHWTEPGRERESTDAVEQHCHRHGVTPIVHALDADVVPIGEAMLDFIGSVNADLLVMGCYGHSRVREFVLGGASRSVLDAMTLPVLMAH